MRKKDRVSILSTRSLREKKKKKTKKKILVGENADRASPNQH